MAAELFGPVDRDRADQNRLALLVALLDFLDDGVELLAFGAIDDVRIFDAAQRPVGGNRHDVELVDLQEFFRFGFRRTGHAGQLLVHAEVVLEGDRGQRLVFLLDLQAFLGFDGLVQAVAPAAARHQAAGELIDDHDFAVLHHVFHVALEQRVRLQRLVDVVKDFHVGRIVEIVDAQQSVRPWRRLLRSA